MSTIRVHDFIAGMRKCDDAVRSAHVYCFVGGSNPTVFLSRLFLRRASFNAITLDVSQLEPGHVRAQLSTLFLGQQQTFLMPSLNDLGSAPRKELLGWLKTYAGPNKVAFFLPEESVREASRDWLVVRLPEKKDLALLKTVADFFDMTIGEKQLDLIADALKSHSVLTMDGIMLLLDHIQMVGEDLSAFLEQPLFDIVLPDTPFFELGDALFARDATRFFGKWYYLAPWHPPQFWLAMWSDQIFRAHFYVVLRQQGKFAEAKSISWRLPFSFIQRGWKTFSPATLKRAHRALCDLDHDLKNGSSELGLDLFLVRFLASRPAA